MRAHGLLPTRTLAVVALTFFAISCGDGDGPADGGSKDAAPEDAADASARDVSEYDGGEHGALALVSAFTGEGRTLSLRFSAALDPSTIEVQSFRVERASGEAVGVISGAAAAGSSSVALTLDEALDTSSTYRVVAERVHDAAGLAIDPEHASVELETTLHLALIWHQHQPSYVDPAGDYLRGPWVRKHAVKDYYDMTSLAGQFPAIHLMVNLTPILLHQLEHYYLSRLEPYVDPDSGTVDIAGYFTQRTGTAPVTDPWVDMMLLPTPDPAQLTEEERGWFWADIWSTFSISDVMIARFHQYQALREKRAHPETFTRDDLLQMKGWFSLAWFDPDFLRGPVTLAGGRTVDLSDLISEDEEGVFTLRAPFTEEICERLVVEEYKIMAAVVPVHRALSWNPNDGTGQIEVMTTPYYHPILPLLVDTVYKRGSFDMTGLELMGSGDDVEIRLSVNSRIEDPWDSKAWGGNGFSVQMAFVHLDTDHLRGSGIQRGLPGTNVRFAEDEAWDRVVIISPQGRTRVNSEIEAKCPEWKDRIIVPKITRASGKTLIAIVSAAELGGTPKRSWGYQVVMQSNEGFPAKTDLLTRKVNEYEGQHRFGGGSDYDNDPHLIDMFIAPARGTPAEAEGQHKILSGWKRDLAEPKLEDLVVLPMVYLEGGAS